MIWRGKIIGATLGFFLGGPLGALLGMILGHAIDHRAAVKNAEKLFPGHRERVRAAFFTTTFSVLGHIAKADGKVSRKEISLVEMLMREMQLDELQRKAAIKLFNSGKRPDFNLRASLRQFRSECYRRRTLMRMFLEIQIQIAFADGKLDVAENGILQDITDYLGFRNINLSTVFGTVRHKSAFIESHDQSDSDPYKVLGVTADTPKSEINKAYRKLLSRHHPDKLMSKGLSEEKVRLANEKTRKIRQAWKKIKSI